MTSLRRAVLVVALVVHLVAVARLARLEAGGPPHVDLELEGAVPATLFLPGPEGARITRLAPPPPDERPPGVVLMHGICSDRAMISTQARRLAASGYAVLTLDFRGHGANRNPFESGRPDHLAGDVEAAVEYLRGSPFVDGTRIALMGHSMGAGAAHDYASRDSGLDAVVLVSGGRVPLGAYPPPNVLFLVGEDDPERIHTFTRARAAAAAGVDAVDPGTTYGEPTRGDAVRWVEIAGADHTRVIWSDETTREAVAWLDAAFDRPRSGPVDLSATRLRVAAVAFLAFVVLLAGVGDLAGRLATPRGAGSSSGAWLGLVLVVAVSFAAMPLTVVGAPGRFLPMSVTPPLVWLLTLSGLALCGLLVTRGQLGVASLAGARRSFVAAGAAVLATYALLTPLGSVVHELSPTPERLALAIGVSVLVFPFFLAVELLLRRGETLPASLAAGVGRTLLVATFLVGALLGILSRLLLLVVPGLFVLFALGEVSNVALYRRSHDRVAIAALSSAWFGWISAMLSPTL